MNSQKHTEHHHHDITTAEEAVILLKYMYGHNKEHTDELLKATEEFHDEKVAALIKSAAECYNKGNELLREALERAEK